MIQRYIANSARLRELTESLGADEAALRLLPSGVYLGSTGSAVVVLQSPASVRVEVLPVLSNGNSLPVDAGMLVTLANEFTDEGAQDADFQHTLKRFYA
jgi:hypothetical protein